MFKVLHTTIDANKEPLFLKVLVNIYFKNISNWLKITKCINKTIMTIFFHIEQLQVQHLIYLSRRVGARWLSPLCVAWRVRLTVLHPCFPPSCGARPGLPDDAEGVSACTRSSARTTACGLCGVWRFVDTVLVLGMAGLVCSRNLADVLWESQYTVTFIIKIIRLCL